MGEQRGQKLNRLQRLLPEGLLADAAWLERSGYSRPLRSQYVAAGWLEQPARGVYRRPSGKLQWEHVVSSLQALMDASVIVGGRTALELQGFAHYLSAQDTQEIHLYTETSLPGWLDKLDLNAHFVLHNAKKLFHKGGTLRTSRDMGGSLTDQASVAEGHSRARQTWGHCDLLLIMSPPERAILELLDEVPRRETFHQADILMEGLRTLSPRRLQKVLEDCRSVKVKRLFLWFAERHEFRWLRHIERERLDLGSGKRMLVRSGKLDPKYLITVPQDL